MREVVGTVSDFDSPFEVAVARGLQERGWTVHPQIGVSAFRVDIGIVHPDFPGRYLVGVECDGATYHRSATARDRDKVREDILSRLGWKLLRLWSTDFWIDGEGELDRLDHDISQILEEDREVHAAKEAEPVEAEAEPLVQDDIGEDGPTDDELADNSDQESLRQESLFAQPVRIQESMYRTFRLVESEIRLDPERFYDAGYAKTLVNLIQAIVEIEGPIREDVIARRVARAHGFKRTGKQILEVVSMVVRKCHNVIAEGEYAFVWPAGITPNEWSFARIPEDEESIRPIDEIPHAELMAFAKCYRQSSDPVEDIKHALGFARLKAPAKERIKTALEHVNDDDRP